MKNLRLLPHECSASPRCVIRSTKPSTLSTPRSMRSLASCRTPWTPIARKKIERMAIRRRIGKTFISFWTISRRSITSPMLSLNTKSVFKTSGVGGYSPKRQKRRTRHEQPGKPRHAPSWRGGVSISLLISLCQEPQAPRRRRKRYEQMNVRSEKKL
jgi:hypothetical protein